MRDHVSLNALFGSASEELKIYEVFSIFCELQRSFKTEMTWFSGSLVSTVLRRQITREERGINVLFAP